MPFLSVLDDDGSKQLYVVIFGSQSPYDNWYEPASSLPLVVPGRLHLPVGI